ncbi:hypothetical protein L2E82_19703 [Cichorium intybus]|uniref:Uncharacterized protein n=1 Tax=Cichorium intybus TaxID=13427 RepID=A0ACB9FE04_CICIN|nr:hypothetical protein L2E82_19703 [Cichorium intybus]
MRRDTLREEAVETIKETGGGVEDVKSTNDTCGSWTVVDSVDLAMGRDREIKINHINALLHLLHKLRTDSPLWSYLYKATAAAPRLLAGTGVSRCCLVFILSLDRRFRKIDSAVRAELWKKSSGLEVHDEEEELEEKINETVTRPWFSLSLKSPSSTLLAFMPYDHIVVARSHQEVSAQPSFSGH